MSMTDSELELEKKKFVSICNKYMGDVKTAEDVIAMNRIIGVINSDFVYVHSFLEYFMQKLENSLGHFMFGPILNKSRVIKQLEKHAKTGKMEFENTDFYNELSTQIYLYNTDTNYEYEAKKNIKKILTDIYNKTGASDLIRSVLINLTPVIPDLIATWEPLKNRDMKKILWEISAKYYLYDYGLFVIYLQLLPICNCSIWHYIKVNSAVRSIPGLVIKPETKKLETKKTIQLLFILFKNEMNKSKHRVILDPNVFRILGSMVVSKSDDQNKQE